MATPYGPALQPRSTTISVARRDDNEMNSDDAVATTTKAKSSIVSLPAFLLNRRPQQRGNSQSPSRMTSLGLNLKRVARVSSRNLNINLRRSKLYNSFPNLARKDSQLTQQGFNIDDENVQKVLKAFESDHVVSTNAEDNRYRRTVHLQKTGDNEKFGFTIQSYTFRHSNTGVTERITYVDYVELDSSAFVAGLRAGDVILSINGRNVQSASHKQLVACVSQSSTLRMVVLFENCVNRIELCTRAIKLERLLADKELEFRILCAQEERILSGRPPLTEVEIFSSLRTPCPTPRSGSFSIQGNNDAISLSLASLQSAQSYFLMDKFSRSNDSQSDLTVCTESDDQSTDTIHFMEIPDIDVASDAKRNDNQTDYAAGAVWRGRRSATESDLGILPSLDYVDGVDVRDDEEKNDQKNDQRIQNPEKSSPRLGDDCNNDSTADAFHGEQFGLVHVLHVDDSDSATGECPGDVSRPAVTRF